jgi:hypothetical protein
MTTGRHGERQQTLQAQKIKNTRDDNGNRDDKELSREQNRERKVKKEVKTGEKQEKKRTNNKKRVTLLQW